MSIANCKRCNKIFQKRLSDQCTDCLQITEQEFRNVYRLLQRSSSDGGIAISQLSHETGVPIEEIEEFYVEGRLGTAASYLKYECATCGVLVGALQRKGRFCVNCSEKNAQDAGVEVKSKSDIDKRDKKLQEQQEQADLLRRIRENRMGGNSGRRGRSGFARRTR